MIKIRKNGHVAGLGFLLASAVILASCGGGDSSNSTPPTTVTSVTSVSATTSTNQVEKALTDGIYHLWGFNVIFNNVPQVFISKTEMAGSNIWNAVKVFGAMDSFETAPRLDDGITFVGNGTVFYSWSFPANSTQADLSIPIIGSPTGTPTWTFTLNQQDISGQTVISQIKRLDGSLLSPTLANAGTVFPAGSIAYTATFTAVAHTVANGWTLRNGLLPVSSETNMYGTGWCQTVAGQTNKLGVRIDAANVISLFDVTTCNFTGLTPFATGSWTKQTSANGDIVYTISYPASVTTSPMWAPAFANGYGPANINKTPDLIINAANTTSFMTAYDVPIGSTYTSVQPFFNSAALPALRSAAGI